MTTEQRLQVYDAVNSSTNLNELSENLRAIKFPIETRSIWERSWSYFADIIKWIRYDDDFYHINWSLLTRAFNMRQQAMFIHQTLS